MKGAETGRDGRRRELMTSLFICIGKDLRSDFVLK